ncbi:MAG TPA: aspartate carbamoyltransferase [Burkholderiaceae bacterium]
MKHPIQTLALCLAAALPFAAHSADAARQAEVARLGADVMPFSLAATTHVFTKAADGGTQRVIAKDPADTTQVKLVRQHLRQIEQQFRQRDFSGPAHIHGHTMPGLAQLQAAGAGELAIGYREVEGGAELTYRSASATLVAALHQWFDAQLSDHGADAMAGHMHDMHDMHHAVGQMQ